MDMDNNQNDVTKVSDSNNSSTLGNNKPTPTPTPKPTSTPPTPKAKPVTPSIDSADEEAKKSNNVRSLGQTVALVCLAAVIGGASFGFSFSYANSLFRPKSNFEIFTEWEVGNRVILAVLDKFAFFDVDYSGSNTNGDLNQDEYDAYFNENDQNGGTGPKEAPDPSLKDDIGEAIGEKLRDEDTQKAIGGFFSGLFN